MSYGFFPLFLGLNGNLCVGCLLTNCSGGYLLWVQFGGLVLDEKGREILSMLYI